MYSTKRGSEEFLERTLQDVQEQLKSGQKDEVTLYFPEKWIKPVGDYLSERGCLIVRKGIESKPRGLSWLFFRDGAKHYLRVSRS